MWPWRLYSFPDKVISDCGSQFVAKFWKELLALTGTEQAFTSEYHSQTNGQTESTDTILKRFLHAYVDYQQSNWVSLIPFAEYSYNNSVHNCTVESPFKVTQGFEGKLIPRVGKLVEVTDGNSRDWWT